MTVSEFNALSADVACDFLMSCCYCRNWAQKLIQLRPFEDYVSVENACVAVWAEMTEADYLEAFGHHAKIGDLQKLKDKFSTATKEQGQVLQADENVITALYEGNQRYEQQNGFIFIVCASGKSAEEMLAILTQRLANSRDTELANAAREQEAIMKLRLAAKFAETGESK